jgi:hypothetical protein
MFRFLLLLGISCKAREPLTLISGDEQNESEEPNQTEFTTILPIVQTYVLIAIDVNSTNIAKMIPAIIDAGVVPADDDNYSGAHITFIDMEIYDEQVDTLTHILARLNINSLAAFNINPQSTDPDTDDDSSPID